MAWYDGITKTANKMYKWASSIFGSSKPPKPMNISAPRGNENLGSGATPVNEEQLKSHIEQMSMTSEQAKEWGDRLNERKGKKERGEPAQESGSPAKWAHKKQQVESPKKDKISAVKPDPTEQVATTTSANAATEVVTPSLKQKSQSLLDAIKQEHKLKTPSKSLKNKQPTTLDQIKQKPTLRKAKTEDKTVVPLEEQGGIYGETAKRVIKNVAQAPKDDVIDKYKKAKNDEEKIEAIVAAVEKGDSAKLIESFKDGSISPPKQKGWATEVKDRVCEFETQTKTQEQHIAGLAKIEAKQPQKAADVAADSTKRKSFVEKYHDGKEASASASKGITT